MDGWKFTFGQPRVRAVTLGLATGLIGGGMLVPLGPEFASNTLNAGEAGFGFLIFSMGVGVALGILTLSVIQKRVPKDWTFSGAVLGASISLFFAAAMTSLRASATFVAMLGIFAGAVYVVGFTLLHENVDDEMRGRIFGSLYTLVRFCVLLAFAVGPLLAGVLDNLSSRLFGSDKRIGIFGVDLFVPGVRLALWLASLIILFAAAFAARNLRSARRLDESTSA
jgi:dTMP kinase